MRVKPFVATLLFALLVAATPALGAINDVIYSEQWGLQQIRAEQAWASSTGRGVVVAVLDTGVDFGHPDLGGKSAGSYTCIQGNCRQDSPGDPHGHGTHVAGIIGAVTNNDIGVASVAPDATIMAIKVCPGQSCDGDAVSRALRFATDQGASVINMSLGSILPVFNTIDWKEDLNYAWRNGVVVVASAGNNAQIMTSYAASEGTVVVGATGPNDERAAYSSGTFDVTLYAPGGNASGSCTSGTCIISTWKGRAYQAAQGTSMAAPHVAGVAAQLVCLGHDNRATVNRMIETADQTSAGRRVNAAKAVSTAGTGRCAAQFSAGTSQRPAPGGASPAGQQPAQTLQPGQKQEQEERGQEPEIQEQNSEEETAAVAGEEEGGNKTLNLIVAASLGTLLAGWIGWSTFKASRARSRG